MRIFMQCIFKCKNCTFNTTTTLNINESKEIESEYQTSILQSFFETESGMEHLAKLQKMFPVITDKDIENYKKSETIRRILFCIDIVDGHIRCDECGLIYPIKESILDTVDCIEQ